MFITLIVVAVSYVLFLLIASTGCGRECQLDAKRISDLSQIRHALQGYFDKCGVYPGGTPKAGSDSACVGISTPVQWAGTFVANISKDPVTGANYSYCFMADGSSYALQARLGDSTNPALAVSLAAPPVGCTNTEGTVTCDKSIGEYCVGP